MVPIFVAVDSASPLYASYLLSKLGDLVDIKLGLEYFIANGPAACKKVRDVGATQPRKLFLDLKLHDIPNTMAGAVRAAAVIEPDFLSLFIDDPAAMKAAVEAANQAASRGYNRPKLLGVSVLTSVPTSVGVVVNRALAAKAAGLDGIICSAREARTVRVYTGPNFFIMTPGITLGEDAPDQRRTATVQEAVAAGSNGLVIGRAIRNAPDPLVAVHAIRQAML